MRATCASVVAFAVVSVGGSWAQAQQWNGAQNATGDINRTGKVGLGTSTPQDVLHVFRNSASTAGVLMGNSLVPAGRRGFLIDYHGTGGAELWNFENTDMWFATNGSRRMTIRNDGRVGIGTATPTDVLHLFSGSATTTGVLMGNSLVPAGRRGFLVDFHSSGGAELWNFENSDMWFGTNGTRRMTIKNDGRVGIATEPHTFGFSFDSELKLDVQGRLRVHNIEVWDGPGQYDLTWAKGCHSSGSSTICGYLEGTRIITRESSSRRYKDNIRPARWDEVSKVLNLEAVEYEMKDGHGPKGWSTVGFVAEDVERAGLKDLVTYDEEGRPDGVKYRKVAVYVNEVVKAQQQAIRELQRELAELRRRLDAMGAPK